MESQNVEVTRECGGRPRVAGTPLTLHHLLGLLADGWSVPGIAATNGVSPETLAAVVRGVAGTYDVDLYAHLRTPPEYREFVERAAACQTEAKQ